MIQTVIVDGPLRRGQLNYTGAAALLDDLPKAQWLLGDRGYDADWFRDVLEAKGIQPCIPGRRSRNEPVRYDKLRYRRRSRIGRGWRDPADRRDGQLIGTQPFHGVTFDSYRYDCGNKAGYIQANLALALARPDIGPAVRTFAAEMLAD